VLSKLCEVGGARGLTSCGMAWKSSHQPRRSSVSEASTSGSTTDCVISIPALEGMWSSDEVRHSSRARAKSTKEG